MRTLPNDVYVAMAEYAYCKVCGKYKDLRAGACFDCAKDVYGQPIRGGHMLWIGDPLPEKATKVWKVRNQ